MPTDEKERNQAAWLTVPKGYPLEVLGRISFFHAQGQMVFSDVDL